jgi:GNAT superfamily N-acetyltransferase
VAILLEPDDYADVRPLFEGMTYHLAALTVLGGTLPGRIYVDEPVSPRTAIVIPANQHRLYLGGPPERSLLEDVMDLLAKQSGAESHGFVVYYDPSNPWNYPLVQVLQEQEQGGFSACRQFYRLRGPFSPSSEPLPERITIGRIDEAMVGDGSLENRDLLREEILSESPLLEHFFRRNFGFAAQDGHKVVGWCLAEYRYQDRCELGIETIEAYRRQGIAAHLASAVIRQAFAEGATEIGWHCWATNAPSVATALRLGFEKALEYPVCYVEYRQAPA